MNIFKTSLVALSVLSTTSAVQAAEQTAIFAGGCFWCVESDFEAVKGVKDVVTGYIGGSAETATYKRIGKGGTGHYEAAKIVYDPKVVSYDELLDIFWRSVDATDAGGQFCDRGPSYRTGIFALNDAQRKTAQKSKAALDASGQLPKPVVTEIKNASPFYLAEEYHQDYYKKSDLVITRFGPTTKAKAYKKYRDACGRDQRVKQLWGKDAYIHDITG
ncbi:peptide-methionine (S)-S-oxide reductase MsrA [Amylibacter sp. SFDW26]|uniref:peptide-methionine (S)-S-oxide reductase MsrA n=1 Tax=Amylibacter sp. SFDW26 TaxID=2652722 RepID=UPI001261BB9B|nr:peptide-methionine (S)-S-oxide reductase MsrA [Amylibacter sp. SFDW26]KAB7614680.1 peptide-methionine (S)-S-oxide reductase MsrA [Amylibacter sp. SFDW26]